MTFITSKNTSKLDLSNHNLSKFPLEILRLKNLKKLNLSGNNISNIPKEIEKLKNLEILDLSNNNISSFYSKICSLKKLKVLNLNNNKIKTIPKQLKNLGKLRILQLANNRFTSLPNLFLKLESLQEINISRNLFTVFPVEILEATSLKKVWINNLQLEHFPAHEITNKLPNLNGIYCYGTILNQDLVDKNYVRLSKIKGNSFPFLVKSSKNKPLIPKKSKKQNIQKNKIFISYSHKDKDWLSSIQTHLKVLNFDHDFDLWDDTKIKSGQKWKEEIENALNVAGIAILIISTDFLASDFIRSNELPSILKNAEVNGTKILPIIVKPCRFTKTKSLSIFQAVNDPSKPLSSLSESEKESELVKLTDDVSFILSE